MAIGHIFPCHLAVAFKDAASFPYNDFDEIQ
jgi:hypothetical protein